MVPKEGLLGYSCGLVRRAKAPGDEEAAYDFINAMLDPEVGQVADRGAGLLPLQPPKSYKMVDPRRPRQHGREDPAKTFGALALDPEPEEPYRSKYIEFITEIKAGSS